MKSKKVVIEVSLVEESAETTKEKIWRRDIRWAFEGPSYCSMAKKRWESYSHGKL